MEKKLKKINYVKIRKIDIDEVDEANKDYADSDHLDIYINGKHGIQTSITDFEGLTADTLTSALLEIINRYRED